MTESHRVFLYGTIKTGQPLNHLFDGQQGIRLLGRAVTVDKYPLVIACRYNYPFLLDVKGKGHFVYGEVYEVDDASLKRFDRGEAHPDYYTRSSIPVRCLNREQGRAPEEGLAIEGEDEPGEKSADTVQCYVYLMQGFCEELLQAPCYADYDSAGEHGKPYTPIPDYKYVGEPKAACVKEEWIGVKKPQFYKHLFPD